MANQRLLVASGDALDVRQFNVYEGLSEPFQIAVTALTRNADVDFEAIVGQEASFSVTGARGEERTWVGVCNHIAQTGVDEELPGDGAGEPDAERGGLCSYSISVVPRIWLLTQRRNHRIFQRRSVPEIAEIILSEHGVTVQRRLSEPHEPHEYRVQYGESDFVFVSRLLAEEGISYLSSPEGTVVLDDQPEAAEARPALGFDASPSILGGEARVSDVRVGELVRPGRRTHRDFDFEKPDYALFGEAEPVDGEAFYEQYVYEHGAFTSDAGGKRRAQIAMQAHRNDKRRVAFASNVTDLKPGDVLSIVGHPRQELGGERLLVMHTSLNGSDQGEWMLDAECVFAREPFRPPQQWGQPRIVGVQSAVVVGPDGEEIYTDEHGRVKVQFHWDRDGRHDEDSSCWLRVSHAWAGAGFGMVTLPRVGQEVLVSFWEGNPDQPVVSGRVYNGKMTAPYKLPDHATRSTFKSSSTPNAEGYNEIYFEDKAGEELLYVHAQRDRSELVKRDAAERTGGSRRVEIARDRATIVRRDDATLVGGALSFAIARVGADGALEPSDTRIEIGDGAISLTTGQAHVCLDGPDVIIKADRDIAITSAGEVVIHGGPLVKINC